MLDVCPGMVSRARIRLQKCFLSVTTSQNVLRALDGTVFETVAKKKIPVNVDRGKKYRMSVVRDGLKNSVMKSHVAQAHVRMLNVETLEQHEAEGHR